MEVYLNETVLTFDLVALNLPKKYNFGLKRFFHDLFYPLAYNRLLVKYFFFQEATIIYRIVIDYLHIFYLYQQLFFLKWKLVVRNYVIYHYILYIYITLENYLQNLDKHHKK